MSKKYAFIGVGNMGGAVARAVCRGVGAENVVLFNPTAAKAQAIARETGCDVAFSAREAAEGADFVVLGVKPYLARQVAEEAAPAMKPGAVLVSMAAGVTLEDLKKALSKGGAAGPVIRIMPNTPMLVGRGTIAMSPSGDTDGQSSDELKEALSAGGDVFVMSEKQLDAATPVFGCSPAFTYMYIEALADGAVRAGVPRDMAQRLAAGAVMGAAAMVLETGKHPGRLKDEVCSPGGSTIVGVQELEKGAFRGTVASAVYEAFIKNNQLGKA